MIWNKLRDLSLAHKITANLVLIGLTITLTISFLFYFQSKRALKNTTFNNLTSLRDAKKEQVTDFFNDKHEKLVSLSQFLSEGLSELSVNDTSASSSYNTAYEIDDMITSSNQEGRGLLSVLDLEEVFLVSTQGEVIYSTNIKFIGVSITAQSDQEYMGFEKAYKQGMNGYSIIDFGPSPILGDKKVAFIATPVVYNEAQLKGVLISYIKASELNNILSVGISKSGLAEAYLVDENQKLVANAGNSTEVVPGKTSFNQPTVRQALDAESDIKPSDNFLGKPVISAFAGLFDEDIPRLALLIEASESQVFASLLRVKIFLIVVSILVAIGLFFMGLYVSRSILGPFQNVITALDKISMGNLKIADITHRSKDEIGKLTNAINNLVNGLRKTSEFATEIGKGNLEAEFTPLSDEDALGNALLAMRNNLRQVADEDKKRNWANEGHAKFGEILRTSGSEYTEFGDHILTELIKYLNAELGALYLVNEENDEVVLERMASYAYDRSKFIEEKVKPGDGYVGQVYLEKKYVYLKKVPKDFVSIKTGLGASIPQYVLVMPLVVNDTIEGIIEVASFNELESYKIDFLEKLGESIASTISSNKINAQTKKLLEESQMQAEQMRAQEEEMRQNMEELQAAQEDLQRRNAEYQKIQDNLELEKLMLEALMDNLPDRITFKDTNSKFLRANKAKLQRHNMTNEELQGKSDFDFFDKEHATKAYNEEQDILQKGEPLIGIEERIVYNDGTITWAATSRIPFRDKNDNVAGMLIFSQNITENKRNIAMLHDRKLLLDDMIARLPFVFYRVDHDRHLVDIKGSAMELIDMTGSALENKSVFEVFPEAMDELQGSGQEAAEAYPLVFTSVARNGKETVELEHHVLKDTSIDNGLIAYAFPIG